MESPLGREKLISKALAVSRGYAQFAAPDGAATESPMCREVFSKELGPASCSIWGSCVEPSMQREGDKQVVSMFAQLHAEDPWYVGEKVVSKALASSCGSALLAPPCRAVWSVCACPLGREKLISKASAGSPCSVQFPPPGGAPGVCPAGGENAVSKA